MQKKYLIGALAVIIVCIIGGALFFTSTSVERAPDELVMTAASHTGEPETGFNPLTGWGCGHVNFEPLIQSTLFKSDDDGNIINDLATDYQVEDGGKKWIVHIRDDVKFSDGTPLTAEDVAFTFNEARHSNSELDMSNLDKATAIDNKTVEFDLKEAQSTFIWKLRYVGIVPEASYDNETYGENPIGSGPYKLVQWDKGQQAIFELNENYYGEKPFFKKITMLFLEGDASISAVKSGDVDIAGIDITQVDNDVEGYELINLSSGRAQGISFPIQNDTGLTSDDGDKIGNNVTADIAIRKALNTAMNRSKIVDEIYYGYGSPEYTGIDSRDYGNPDAKVNDSNVGEAKKILEEGGWKDTDGDGIVDKNGTKASFKIYYTADDQVRQALATVISEEAKEIGIEAELVGTDWDDIYKNQYSSAVLFQQSSIDPYHSVYLQFHSKEADDSYMNPGLYNNSQVDSYLDQALVTSDEGASNELWKQAAFDGTTGFGPAGDATWLWIVSHDNLYMVDESIDMGTPAKNSGADILQNIWEWKRVNATA
ncbi:ABC transporter substrate-binding protein [Methanobrevibacter sp. DSM 116169]|uniref:ABC transporter substrate-binding protein n=1 Tax=Methanobrevibacter sp. DSM 116169 TaxID=3242727 RepID=UPI0038FC6D46